MVSDANVNHNKIKSSRLVNSINMSETEIDNA